MRRLVWIALFAACSSTPSPKPSPSPAAPAAAVTALADEVLAAWVQAFPNQAALAGLEGAPADGMEDNSLAAIAAWRAREDAWWQRIAAIDSDALWGQPEWITYGFLREFLEGARAARVCRNELWPVNQMSGWPFMVMQLADMQPVGTAPLRDKALSRWRAIPAYIDHEIENAREGLRLGYSSPRANVDLVIKQLDDLLALPVEKSPFWGPAARDAELVPAWKALLQDGIYPAMKRQRDFLHGEYRGKAREALGISANPDGVACYRASFRGLTTIDRAPEETYALGEATVASNLAEAQEIAVKVLGVKELPAIVARLRGEPTNRFRSRDELLELSRSAATRAKAAMPQAFSVVPRADVVIEPYPAFLEATASDSYEPAPVDASRPAKYRINLSHADEVTRSAAETTVFHETYPGHHLQIMIARETSKRHPIVQLIGNSAYVEGWARYAEALAEELGLYSSDLARIQRRLWPARGMVADPGLHLRGWTVEQTTTFLKAAGRFTDAEIDALIYRISAWPAQLTAYDTGGIEIKALRRKAEEALGARFDLRAFHQAVLENGAVTLPMLRTIIDRWIETQRGS